MLSTSTMFELLVTLTLALSVAAAPTKPDLPTKLMLRETSSQNGLQHPHQVLERIAKSSAARFSQSYSGTEMRSRRNNLNVRAATSASPPQATVTILATGSNKDGYSSNISKTIPSTSKLTNHSAGITTLDTDRTYTTEVQIGTPPQTYHLEVDMGAALTWVTSSDCSITDCGNHTTLGPDTSSTYSGTFGGKFDTPYGTARASGNIARDVICLGGLCLTGQQQKIGVATNLIGFRDQRVDGMLGLAPQLETLEYTTPIVTLAKNGLVKNAVVGYALGRAVDDNNDGEITFGAVDKSKYDPKTTQTLDLVRNSNNQSDFWRVEMPYVKVNGKTTAQSQLAILDAATNAILTSPDAAKAFHELIPGSKHKINTTNPYMYEIPCTTNASVTMQFGLAEFQLDVRDLLFAPSTKDHQGQCISSIVGIDGLGNDTWLLGAPFLKNVYLATDSLTNKVQMSGRVHAASGSGGKCKRGV